MNAFLQTIGIELPIIQAPMAGVSTPDLAAAVCNAGALGSISVGATDAAGALAMIAAVRQATDRPFNVNVFVHRKARIDRAREQTWLSQLAPHFRSFGVEPPGALREIYTSFVENDAMLEVLLTLKPAVVSLHFGLPGPDRIDALKAEGAVVLASVTSLAEARAAVHAGVDAVVAQGYEAGGHRGVFDPDAPDDRIGVFPLTRILARMLPIPVIAAGGIMDGAGIASALKLGAVAAQLGTAFVGCPESAADDAYRAALFGPGGAHTVVTRAISGRPARCLTNRFTALAETLLEAAPDYPIAYDAGKALHAAAKAAGEGGFGAQWAGQGAPLAREMPAGRLIEVLLTEFNAAR